MAGVDLNTVKELLGHAKLDMTIRYAHLAPEQVDTLILWAWQNPTILNPLL
jgi:site-specific recombinase XerD